MRCRIFPTLVFLASGCGGARSGVAQGAPIADASTGVDGGGPVGDASSDAAAAADGRACTFVASNYDQSCVTNTDCVAVRLGDYCDPTRCYCDESLGAIKATALAQFNADVAKTPIGSDAVSPQGLCSCLAFSDPGACCVAGKCQFSSRAIAHCVSPMWPNPTRPDRAPARWDEPTDQWSAGRLPTTA